MDLKVNNWYYVQVFVPGTVGGLTTICFAPNKDAAVKEVNRWLTEHGHTPETAKIHLYHKNYKREAATMVAKSNFIIA